MTDLPDEYWGRSYEEYLDDLRAYDLTPSENGSMLGSCTVIDRERPVRSPALPQSPSPRADVETPHLNHFTVLRRDIPVGFAMAQNTHASGESAGLLGAPVPEGTYAYCLQVANEDELLDVSRRLDEAGIAHVLVREPDEPWCGQATAIGVVPTRRKRAVDRVVGSLPRYK